MNTTNQTQTVEANSNQERIALAAYYLWEKDGCQSGREVEYWLLAEKQVQDVSPSPPRKVNSNPATASPRRAPAQPTTRPRNHRLNRDLAASVLGVSKP